MRSARTDDAEDEFLGTKRKSFVYQGKLSKTRQRFGAVTRPTGYSRTHAKGFDRRRRTRRLSAAAALGGAGFDVELFEARPFLGGRATSYAAPAGEDGAEPETIDNCQHILLRCCVNLLDFYTRLGVRERGGEQQPVPHRSRSADAGAGLAQPE